MSSPNRGVKSTSPEKAPNVEVEKKIKQKLKEKNQQKDFFSSPYIYVAIGIGVVANIIFYSINSKVLFPLTYQSSSSARGDFFQKFIGSSGLKDIARQIKGNMKLEKLELNLALNGFNSDSLVDFAEKLATVRNLVHLQLSISHNTVNELAFITLIRAIGALRDLKHLQLAVDGVDSCNYNTTAIFQLELPRLQSLRSFQISTIHNNLTLGGVDHIVNGIGALQQLTNLELVLISSGVNQTGVDLIAKTVTNITTLQNLTLNFYANRIGVEGAKTLAPYVKQWKNLEGLNLDFFFNNITRVGTEAITASITELEKLTFLRLNLDFNYIETEGGIAVGKMLRKLRNVRSLAIGCASKNFGSNGFHEIAMGIKAMDRLENLTVVCGVNRVSSVGADDMADVLQTHNATLKNVRIDFLENYVGDQGAKTITDALPLIQNLENLDLSLNFNYLMDYGVMQTMKNIEQVSQQLKQLRVDLSHNQIGDGGAKDLFTVVENVAKTNAPFEFLFLDTTITNSTKDFLIEKMAPYQNFNLKINSIVSQEYLDKKAQNPEFSHTKDQIQEDAETQNQ